MKNIIDPLISLDQASHTYRHASHPELSFTSCTQFIGSFFEPFDASAIAKNLTEKYPKYQGKSPDELIQEWREKADYGSLVHSEIDAYLREGKQPVEALSQAGISWLQRQSWPAEKIASEVILYSTNLKLAGTIDLITQDPQTGAFTLYDWKTSKRIDRKSFDDKCGIKGIACQLPHCNYVTYSLQLSLYAHMLESYGATVDSIHILHLDKSDNSVKQIEAHRYANEIEQMLKELSV